MSLTCLHFLTLPSLAKASTCAWSYLSAIHKHSSYHHALHTCHTTKFYPTIYDKHLWALHHKVLYAYNFQLAILSHIAHWLTTDDHFATKKLYKELDVLFSASSTFQLLLWKLNYQCFHHQWLPCSIYLVPCILFWTMLFIVQVHSLLWLASTSPSSLPTLLLSLVHFP